MGTDRNNSTLSPVYQLSADDPSIHGRMKSHFSGMQCVEVGRLDAGSALRAVGGFTITDSKNPGGAALVFDGPELSAFIEGVKAGQFDHFLEQ